MANWIPRLILLAALAAVCAAPVAAQEGEAQEGEVREQEEFDRFLEECGGEEHGEEQRHGREGDESRLSDRCIPLAEIPNRPRPPIELGAPFLGTGVLAKGIKLPGGAVWQPSFMVFAAWRNAVQGANVGLGDVELAEAVSRLDLFGNLYLTQTERILVGFRPLDEDGRFTTFTLHDEPEGLFADDRSALNFRVTTLFFEGDFSELFPDLDKDDSAALDYYFSVGRQPLGFQDGALVSEDQMDMLGLTRANMRIGGLINTRVTGVWGWNQVTRHSAAGNFTDPDAMLFGLFSEIDIKATTLEFDAAFVTGSDTTGDGLHLAFGDTRRIGQFNNTLCVMASFPIGDETLFNSRGFLIQNQFGWTAHHSHNWWYVGVFVGIDQFRSAARGESAGGPAGRTGVLFAAPGIGRVGAPLGNQVDDAVGGAIGYQMFFGHTRQQLLLELGGRAGTSSDAPGGDLVGVAASYQAAIWRRWVAVLQSFGTYDFELEDFAVTGRLELQLRL